MKVRCGLEMSSDMRGTIGISRHQRTRRKKNGKQKNNEEIAVQIWTYPSTHHLCRLGMLAVIDGGGGGGNMAIATSIWCCDIDSIDCICSGQCIQLRLVIRDGGSNGVGFLVKWILTVVEERVYLGIARTKSHWVRDQRNVIICCIPLIWTRDWLRVHIERQPAASKLAEDPAFTYV